ncbi:hypothetical protein QVD99_005049 [Batrachochytrium dendrobatidis]|nr:hypothetical protein O5D80_004507 [Batrachochytrium dendrobatidis]KAK5668004.1 hypothetical protein QVD99_005049 [Batrachochytrium dendrobatidis]
MLATESTGSDQSGVYITDDLSASSPAATLIPSSPTVGYSPRIQPAPRVASHREVCYPFNTFCLRLKLCLQSCCSRIMLPFNSSSATGILSAVFPIALWLLLFSTCKYIPSEWRPQIHVDILPSLDHFFFQSGFGLLLSAIFSISLGYIWTLNTTTAGYYALVPLAIATLYQIASISPNTAFDLLLILPYGLLHYLSPFVFIVWLYFYGPTGSISLFAKAFGWQNVVGVVIQLIFPCAAPWYNDKNGYAPADYSMPGDPAGLVNLDKLFGTHIYTTAFNSSPLVFGAIPSLHSGFACLIMLFVIHIDKRYKYFAVAYISWMWAATIYFRHHYIIDIVVGGLCSLITFSFCQPYFTHQDAAPLTFLSQIKRNPFVAPFLSNSQRDNDSTLNTYQSAPKTYLRLEKVVVHQDDSPTSSKSESGHMYTQSRLLSSSHF